MSLAELHGLFRDAFYALARAELETDVYRNALASLEAIETEHILPGPAC
ncbi:MAG: hypothetical protein AAF968_02380 [Pseudomonadota bacterium]